jgi:hypothetical protein
MQRCQLEAKVAVHAEAEAEAESEAGDLRTSSDRGNGPQRLASFV